MQAALCEPWSRADAQATLDLWAEEVERLRLEVRTCCSDDPEG